MGYELEAHFDAPTARPKLQMVQLLLELAGDRHRRGRSALETEEELRLSARDRDAVLRHVERELTEAEFLSVNFFQRSPEDETELEAYLWFTPPVKPDDHPYYCQPVPFDVDLSLRAWVHPEPTEALPGGLTPDQRRALGHQLFMLETARRLCTLGDVARGYVYVEQRVFNPLCYRLMFHADPAGFSADLQDVVELALRGGRAFGERDSRYEDEPLMFQGAASIRFCDRTRDEVVALRTRLERVLPALDARGVPIALPEELVQRAAARSGRYVVFDDGRGGLGVRGLPPMNAGPNHNYAQFPVAFLDEFYLDLAELVLDS